MSAFLLYSQALRPQVKLDYPNVTNNELSVILARQWRQSSMETKEPYLKRELEARRQYHLDVARWKASKCSTLENIGLSSESNLDTSLEPPIHSGTNCATPMVNEQKLVDDIPSDFWDLLDSEMFEDHGTFVSTETETVL